MVQGDTDAIASGMGTGGSSSIPCGGASVAGAARKLADNLKALAADALEAGPADLEIAAGTASFERKRHEGAAHLLDGNVARDEDQARTAILLVGPTVQRNRLADDG